MPTRSSPLLGYNNNVRHKGKVFHIQTEDSGVKYGHIMTHLFTDGGRIVKSVKTSYAEYVESERLTEIVREMMKQQHKAMFIALREGRFDAIADGTGDTAVSLQMAARVAPFAASVPIAVSAESSRAVALAPQVLGEVASDGAALSSADVPRANARMLLGGHEPEELPLDIEGLERAAFASDAAALGASVATPLPSPPARLVPERASNPPPAIAAVPPPVPRATGAPPAATLASERSRYAPTRPASIFGQALPQQGKSLFGGDVPEDKSLDDVIMSYLGETERDEEK